MTLPGLLSFARWRQFDAIQGQSFFSRKFELTLVVMPIMIEYNMQLLLEAIKIFFRFRYVTKKKFVAFDKGKRVAVFRHRHRIVSVLWAVWRLQCSASCYVYRLTLCMDMVLEINELLFCCAASDPGFFLPYAPPYGDVVTFFDRDEGYSNTMFFRQNFLLGCRYYRRFWVRCCCRKVIAT